VTGKLEEMIALVTVEPQRRGEGVQHLFGGADLPPLLQVRVPGGADPGQQCQFLSAKSRSPAAAGLGQAHLVRGEALSPSAQKRTQLTALVALVRLRGHGTFSSRISAVWIPG
jgi:hypothetical protein